MTLWNVVFLKARVCALALGACKWSLQQNESSSSHQNNARTILFLRGETNRCQPNFNFLGVIKADPVSTDVAFWTVCRAGSILCTTRSIPQRFLSRLPSTQLSHKQVPEFAWPAFWHFSEKTRAREECSLPLKPAMLINRISWSSWVPGEGAALRWLAPGPRSVPRKALCAARDGWNSASGETHPWGQQVTPTKTGPASSSRIFVQHPKPQRKHHQNKTAPKNS